jgi:4-hydroxy-tetrahydrodipicolinate synthase
MAPNLEDGVYAASLTPLHADLSCNNEALTEHCIELINKGCKGVVLFGTTGEGPSFSVEEKKKTIKQVIANGLNPKQIIIGNGSACLADTIDLTLAALENHCLACLIAPPCFYKNVSEAGIIAFYRTLIQRIPNSQLQIILYHIPQYTGVPLTVPIVKTLCAEFPGIVVGLKESEGNLAFTQSILKEVPQCKVFVGSEKQIPDAVKFGASGSICGMANLWPELICSLYENDKRISELAELSSQFKNQPFIATCKAMLADKKNPNWSLVRPPLVPAIPLSPGLKQPMQLLKRFITPNKG